MGAMQQSHDLPAQINCWLQENPNQRGRYWFTDSNQKRLARVQDRKAPGMCFTHGEASFLSHVALINV